ncbi:MAG: hypothetical protein QM756_22515 [Polyangiaceae bacterium]
MVFERQPPNFFGGAATLGFRWQSALSERFAWGFSARLCVGRVAASNVGYLLTDDAYADRTAWFVLPSAVLSVVYR